MKSWYSNFGEVEVEAKVEEKNTESSKSFP
jgi:hypothetical protein